MEAYSKELLLNELKKKNVDSITEDQLAAVVEGLFSWLEVSAVASQTPYDNLAAPLYPLILPIVLRGLDNFDGEDDPGR